MLHSHDSIHQHSFCDTTELMPYVEGDMLD